MSVMEVCQPIAKSQLLGWASGWESSPIEREEGADSPRGTGVLSEFQVKDSGS